MAPFNCSIKSGPTQVFGRIVTSEKSIHGLMTEISLRAISVMMTNSARDALLNVCELWSQYNQQQLNFNTAVSGFQAILARARNDHSQWPTVVMDWTMPEQKDAIYHFVPEAMTTHSQDYPVEAEYIAVNGVRTHCLARDMAQDNPEQYVRKLELIWSYCHEIGHLFITYLNFITNNRTARLGSPEDHVPGETGSYNPKEAGYTLERYLFGGIYVRGWDDSSRPKKFLPGLPLIDTRDGLAGIPLQDVEAIARKNIHSGSYTNSDVAIHPVQLRLREANPERQFPSFYDWFFYRFNRAYSPRGQYNDTDVAPAEITSQMSNTIARAHGGSTMSFGRTVIYWDGRRLDPPKRESRPGSEASSARQGKSPDRKGKSSARQSESPSRQGGPSSNPEDLRHALGSLSIGIPPAQETHEMAENPVNLQGALGIPPAQGTHETPGNPMSLREGMDTPVQKAHETPMDLVNPREGMDTPPVQEAHGTAMNLREEMHTPPVQEAHGTAMSPREETHTPPVQEAHGTAMSPREETHTPPAQETHEVAMNL